MPRIDIELTSARPDGLWTWRAAGARQPKGSVPATLLPEGASVGDVVKADVEVDVEGMTVTTVFPAKTKKGETGRLEVIGPPSKPREDVTVERVTRGPGDGRRDGRRDGRPRDGAEGRNGRDGRAGREDRAGRDGRDRRDRPGHDRDRGEPRTREPATGREPRRERALGPSRPPGGMRPGGPGGPAGERAPGAGRPGPSGERPARTRPRRERQAAAPPPPSKPRPKRLNAGRAHRSAALASLPPEEQVIAEQVLRGGVPAVRQALDEQNAAARAAGQPEVPTGALVAIAERLVPLLRAAEWRDRAEAAIAQVDEIALRDLRALVVGSDAASRDEAGRELAARLRQALDDRSGRERDAWLAEITEALDAGRVVRALRSSSRPPEPGVKFPTELAERLSGAAAEAMGPAAPPDRWLAVLDAILLSPVRRTVKPHGLPAGAPKDLIKTVRNSLDRVPGLGPLVGSPPPPPIGARRLAPPAPPTPATPPAPAEPAAAAAPAPAEPPVAPTTSGDDGHDAVVVEELG